MCKYNTNPPWCWSHTLLGSQWFYVGYVKGVKNLSYLDDGNCAQIPTIYFPLNIIYHWVICFVPGKVTEVTDNSLHFLLCVMEAQQFEPISTLTKGQRVETYLYFFKDIVFLHQTKVLSRFRSENCALSRLLSTGLANIQTLYFKNRQVNMFLAQTKVYCNSLQETK